MNTILTFTILMLYILHYYFTPYFTLILCGLERWNDSKVSDFYSPSQFTFIQAFVVKSFLIHRFIFTTIM